MRWSLVVAFVVTVLVLVGFWFWYRRKIADLAPDAEERTLPGARLTSEHLATLATPPWRTVREISPGHLGSIDHVVIGPAGVVAIETVLADRPPPSAEPAGSDPHLVGAAAVARGDVDDLVRETGIGCEVFARVYWGHPDPALEAAHEVATGHHAVEGQRLGEWLHELPSKGLTESQVDLAWRAVLVGIGRPDPLR